MKKHEIDDEKYKRLKKKAKTFGIIALSIGLVLDVIGFISFFEIVSIISGSISTQIEI